MYQLSMLWWRSHAHAPTSSRVPVAARAPTAMRISANVPTDKITSVRFIVVARFIFLLLSVSSVDILQTSFISYVCDIPAGPVDCGKELSMAYLLPARAGRASRWTSSVLAMRWDFRPHLGDDLCSCRPLPCGTSVWHSDLAGRTSEPQAEHQKTPSGRRRISGWRHSQAWFPRASGRKIICRSASRTPRLGA